MRRLLALSDKQSDRLLRLAVVKSGGEGSERGDQALEGNVIGDPFVYRGFDGGEERLD